MTKGKRHSQNLKATLLELPLPRRKVRIGATTQALIDMEVSDKEPLFFALPEGLTMEQFSGQIGSHIVAARKNQPGSSYSKRMLDFDEGEGIGVWRLK